MYATLGLDYATRRHENDICCADRKAQARAALAARVTPSCSVRRFRGCRQAGRRTS